VSTIVYCEFGFYCFQVTRLSFQKSDMEPIVVIHYGATLLLRLTQAKEL